MGEKYDCEWDDGEPYLRVRPQLFATDAIKSGFSYESALGMAQRWGQGGNEEYTRALGGAVESVQRTRTDVESILRAAGSGRDERLAVGEQALGRMNLGINDFSEKLSSNRMLGVVLNGHEAVDQADFLQRTLRGARNATDAVNKETPVISSLLHDMLGTVQDSAMNALAAKTEAAVNRMGELAYTNAAELYRGVFRRGLLEDPGDGAAATA